MVFAALCIPLTSTINTSQPYLYGVWQPPTHHKTCRTGRGPAIYHYGSQGSGVAAAKKLLDIHCLVCLVSTSCLARTCGTVTTDAWHHQSPQKEAAGSPSQPLVGAASKEPVGVASIRKLAARVLKLILSSSDKAAHACAAHRATSPERTS